MELIIGIVVGITLATVSGLCLVGGAAVLSYKE